MSDLAELLLGLFWDGAMTSAKGQWLHRPIRILVGGLFLLVFLGLSGLLLLVGIDTKNWGLVLLGIGFLAVPGASLFRVYRRRRPPR